jgi:ABC-type sugar transport system ATPase subunit
VVFISHKLEEVMKICDRITILRDGEFINCTATKDVTQDQLIASIVGREVTALYERTPPQSGDVVFTVSNLSSGGVFSDINFELRAGEILGFAGLMGAGRTEIARAIFGIDPYTSGTIVIRQKNVRIKSPKSAVVHGIGMVTEDRLRSGCVYTMSIIGNATLAVFPKICNRLGLFRKKKEETTFDKIVQISNIKYGDKSDKIGSLSGGNQQKVVIGRWLVTEPKILILDEPTRGIDVGAKAEIYKLIDELSAKGIAVILISSELPELFSLCDRIAVIREGKMVATVNTSETTSEQIMRYCFEA